MVDISMTEFQQFVKDHTIRELNNLEAQQMAIMGISGESGELVDIMKKVYFYKKTLNREHVVEELGDIVHYIFMFLNTTDISIQEVLKYNIEKLKARYHTNISREEAMARADKIGKEDDVK